VSSCVRDRRDARSCPALGRWRGSTLLLRKSKGGSASLQAKYLVAVSEAGPAMGCASQSAILYYSIVHVPRALPVAREAEQHRCPTTIPVCGSTFSLLHVPGNAPCHDALASPHVERSRLAGPRLREHAPCLSLDHSPAAGAGGLHPRLASRGTLPRLADPHRRTVLEEGSRHKERHPDTV
jgi:hypothetical protein